MRFWAQNLPTFEASIKILKRDWKIGNALPWTKFTWDNHRGTYTMQYFWSAFDKSMKLWTNGIFYITDCSDMWSKYIKLKISAVLHIKTIYGNFLPMWTEGESEKSIFSKKLK